MKLGAQIFGLLRSALFFQGRVSVYANKIKRSVFIFLTDKRKRS